MPKKIIEEVLVCPACSGKLRFDTRTAELVCQSCQQTTNSVDDKPIFTQIPETIKVTEFRVRGEGRGTPWRQANWDFLDRQIVDLPADGLVLDVGSGRGDFSQLIQQRDSLALDIYPYPEVDIVCDLTQVNPFREDCFDAIVLMNVLEHVFDTRRFFRELARILKPGGKLFVAIPFLLKEHQAPFDFVRYTQFSLRRWGEESGLEIESLEGYYDSIFLMKQGSNNLKHTVIPRLPRLRNYFARILLFGVELITLVMAFLVGNGFTKIPEEEQGPAPIGYHVVYFKPY
jgi:SAM-dependent methyltransferase